VGERLAQRPRRPSVQMRAPSLPRQGERGENTMTYHVYENWMVRKARVHFSDCRWCNHGKGVHPDPSRDRDRWLGPFATLDEALQAAQATREPVSKCKHCRPH